MAEVVRLFAQNARELTGGNQGLSCSDDDSNCFDETWRDVSDTINGCLETSAGATPRRCSRCCSSSGSRWSCATVGLRCVTNTPWGRVLRAVREDEDAARALGKNTLRLQAPVAGDRGALGAVAGFFLALNLATVAPDRVRAAGHLLRLRVLILGGLGELQGGCRRLGPLLDVLEGTRFIDLPDPPSRDQIAALRFAIIGLLLILLMAFRPQGLFGKKEEMVLGD